MANIFITGDSNACGEWSPNIDQEKHQFGRVFTPRSGVSHTGTQHWLTEAGHFAVRQAFPGGSNHVSMQHLEENHLIIKDDPTRHSDEALERIKMSCDDYDVSDREHPYVHFINHFDAIIFFWTGPCRDVPAVINDVGALLLEQSKKGGVSFEQWKHWDELLSFMMVTRMQNFAKRWGIKFYVVGGQQKLPPWIYDFKTEWFIPLVTSIIELSYPDINVPKYTDFQIGAKWTPTGPESFKRQGRNHFTEGMIDMMLDMTQNFWPQVRAKHHSQSDAHPDRWAHKKLTDFFLEATNL